MSTDLETTAHELGGVCDSIMESCGVIEHDSGASPVLRAVVNEFVAKARKAGASSTASGRRDAVIELEQAADSAKAAGEADVGASETTVEAIRQAHLEICVLKSKVLSR